MDDARTRGNEWLCVDQPRREHYEAMLDHGIAGFSTEDTEILDGAMERLRVKQSVSEDSETTCIGQDGQLESKDKSANDSKYDCESELDGFLEHQEETIAPAAPANEFDFSGLSDDLDMASRLGGETPQ